MKKTFTLLIMVLFFGCSNNAPKVTQYDKEKKTIDSICGIYNADHLHDLACEFLIADINTWKKQELAKLKNHVFRIDFFSSIIKSRDSLFLIHRDFNIISKIYLPNNFNKIEEGNYVIFSIDRCDAIINKDEIDFFINGSIINVLN